MRKHAEVLLDLLGGTVSKRVLLVKGIVSCTFVAWAISPELATPVALLGNLVWLWIAPENEHIKIRREVASCIKELHSEVLKLKDKMEEDS